jgi:hypothetical protein
MASAAKTTAATRKGSGKRRRFGGKTGIRVWDPSKKRLRTVGRSNTHGGHSQANAGFECDSTHSPKGAVQTKLLPGEFKVSGPTKRAHRRGFFVSIVDYEAARDAEIARKAGA